MDVLKLHLFVMLKEDMNLATPVDFNQRGGHTLPSLDLDLFHSEFFHPILTIWHRLIDCLFGWIFPCFFLSAYKS